MIFQFEISTLQDARLAQSALDGLIAEYLRGQPAGKDGKVAAPALQTLRPTSMPPGEPVTTVTPVPAPVIPPVQDLSANVGLDAPAPGTKTNGQAAPEEPAATEPELLPGGYRFTKEVMQNAVKFDPGLAELLGGRGRKSNEKVEEINARVAKVMDQITAQIGAALKGESAANLNEALKGVTSLPPGSTAAPSNTAEVLARADRGPTPATPAPKVTLPPGLQGFDEEPEEEFETNPAAEAHGRDEANKLRAAAETYATVTLGGAKGVGWFRKLCARAKVGTIQEVPVAILREIMANPEALA